MEPTGSDAPLLYVLGEAPGKDEDAEGCQFVGKTGRILRTLIPKGFSRVRWNNCVRCRPPGNKTPEANEVESCRASAERDIEVTKPTIVVGVGGVSLRWATGRDGIKIWRGRRTPIKVGNHVCWFYPILHPSFISRMRNGRDEEGIGPEWEPVFKRDVARVLDDATRPDTPRPEVEDLRYLDSGITIYDKTTKANLSAICRFMDTARGKSPLVPTSIDLETSTLRPYAPGAKVLSCAISIGSKTVAFPVDHPEAAWSHAHRAHLLDSLFRLFHSPTIMVAHNAIFELEWLASLFGTSVVRAALWVCTQQQAYIIDNRKTGKKTRGGTGQSLDFLCRLWFGFDLKAQSTVNPARAGSAPIKKLLMYNGRDAKYAHKLEGVQRDAIQEMGLLDVFNEHMRRIPSIVLAQATGVLVDTDVSKRMDRKYRRRIDKIGTEIAQQPEVRKFRKRTGKDFEPSSPNQVATLLRDVAHCREGLTRLGGYSTGKAVLDRIKRPIARLILRHREVTKLHGTYITVFLPGSKVLYPDSRLHTQYNASFTGTGRLSSEDPNLQNIPFRTEEGRRIRKAFPAPPGHVMVAADYGQIEPRLIAMASRDKNLLAYIKDRRDVHGVWSERIARTYKPVFEKFLAAAGGDKERAIEDMRTDVKSNWVLAGFYGSEEDAMIRRYNLPRRIGGRLYRDFREEFEGVYRWRTGVVKQYNEMGYIEMLTGRRRYGPLTLNMIGNSGIQGTASDVLVNAGDRLSERAQKKREPWLQFVMNIHDELVFYIPKERKTLERAIERVIRTMLLVPFSWVCAPFVVSVKTGPTWYDLRSIGKFYTDEL